MRHLRVGTRIYLIIGLSSACALGTILFLLYQVGAVSGRYQDILVHQANQQAAAELARMAAELQRLVAQFKQQQDDEPGPETPPAAVSKAGGVNGHVRPGAAAHKRITGLIGER